jgi:hypothetical protein
VNAGINHGAEVFRRCGEVEGLVGTKLGCDGGENPVPGNFHHDIAILAEFGQTAGFKIDLYIYGVLRAASPFLCRAAFCAGSAAGD